MIERKTKKERERAIKAYWRKREREKERERERERKEGSAEIIMKNKEYKWEKELKSKDVF